ncbi:MAG: cobalamin-binding protein [Legionellales bacterium]|nr:cobalamin-binding protein [Legionellales bacterium]
MVTLIINNFINNLFKLIIAGIIFILNPVYANIIVRDDVGNIVTIAKPATRIVSLAPHLTEMIYALKAGQQLIAVSTYSNFPPAAQKLPVIGSDHGLDLERILALHPDLILAWHSGNPRDEIQQLKKMGIAVYENNPQQLNEIAHTLQNLGKLTGHESLANTLTKQFNQQLSDLKKMYHSSHPLRVFFEIWHQPLITIGHPHYINQAIELCGGKNIFADESLATFQTTPEAVLARNPQIIIASSDDPNWQKTWRLFTTMAAVKHHHLFTLNADLIERPGPRLIQGIKQLCAMVSDASREG